MKYAKEVIGLLSAYPGRDFRMIEIVRYVNPDATTQEKHTVRRSVLRVMDSLVDSGSVIRRPAHTSGGFAAYRWKSAT